MWEHAYRDNELHIIPLADLVVHTYDDQCLCGPIVAYSSEQFRIITHPSLDGRELRELGEMD